MSERENLGFQSGDESEHLVLPFNIDYLFTIFGITTLYIVI